jgi:DNA invertase Pin-like site-specific DNA recombinase
MTTKKAIELIRVSTANQAGVDREGLNSQRDANQKTAKQHDLKIVRRFEIVDVSGANTLHCPEMGELLEWIARPEIEGLICAMFSRVIRSQRNSDLAVVLDALADSATVLYLPDGPIDFNTEDGMLVGTLRGALAGMELRSLVKNMWRGKEAKRRRGIHVGAPNTLPTGVTWEKGHGWRYTSPAERIKNAFLMFDGGDVSYAEVARRCDFNPLTLRCILRNPVYTGWRVYSKMRDQRPGARRMATDGRQAERPKVMRKPDEIIRTRMQYDGVDIEPLISVETFDHVQRLVELKAKNHWKMAGAPNQHLYTYAGFVFCQECGHRLYGEGSTRRYYICKQKRHGHCTAPHQQKLKLEGLLDELIGRDLTSMSFLRRIVDAFVAMNTGNAGARNEKRIQHDLRQLRDRRIRVLDNYEAGHTSANDRDAKLKAIARDTVELEQALRQTAAVSAVTPQRLAEVLKPFLRWHILSDQDKRRILTAAAPQIVCRNYVISGIRLAGLLPAAQSTAAPAVFAGDNRLGTVVHPHTVTDAYAAIYLPITTGLSAASD